MLLRLITLNIEGDKHFDRVLPFLQKENADVVCLQEVYEADLEHITSMLGGMIIFVPLITLSLEHQSAHAPRGLWGIAVWLRSGLVPRESHRYYYRGDEKSALKNGHPGYDASRAVLVLTLLHAGEKVTIATTHFTWTPDGKASEQQRTDQNQLLKTLAPFDELILCGDFNAPRGGAIFSKFEERFTDNLPQDIASTLDPELHRLGTTVQLAVDTIFSRGYEVQDVEVFAGISDHKAIAGTISIR